MLKLIWNQNLPKFHPLNLENTPDDEKLKIDDAAPFVSTKKRDRKILRKAEK